MRLSFREKLKTDIILIDGAFGTYASRKGLKEEDFQDRPGCMEYLCIVKPDLVGAIHSDYLEAGADAVETNTFGATSIKLSEYALADKAYEINLEAVKIARERADEAASTSFPRYVIGTMGPTGKIPSSGDPDLCDVSFGELRKVFYEQALAMIDGGVDSLLVETGQDLLEMKAALSGAGEALKERRKDLVLMAHCTLSNNGRMLLGTDVMAVMGTLPSLGADVIGLNCSTGPVEMEPSLELLSGKCPAYISCVPNAGLPVETEGKLTYPMQPEEMADIMASFATKYKIDIIGGCCGTEPAHIRAMRKKIKNHGKRVIPDNVLCSGFYSAIDLREASRPLKVGERINTQGSRKMKDMLLANDYEGIVELGKMQQKDGADILDVCTVLTERATEKEDAVAITKSLSESVQLPLMIDSTDTGVMREVLENYAGTAFMNSANLEGSGRRAREMFALAKEHGGFVVLLTIDDDGMAGTVSKKLEIAEKLYKMAVEEHGLRPDRLVFDLLTFSLGSGDKDYADSAVNTFSAVRELKKKYPGVFALAGVSNCSFGLGKEARKVLNMAYLHHAVEAGVDIAIVNPAEYIPYGRIDSKEAELAGNLIFNTRPDALHLFVDHFASKASPEKDSSRKKQQLPLPERIMNCVLERDKAGIIGLVDLAREKYLPKKIINEMLMPAMKTVGEKLDRGEMVLPYVLQAAETMKKAIDHLESFIEAPSSEGKGKVLLATVEGDVHDIGKNLVKMVLKNNGFTVIDLGKQVPVEKIVAEAKKNNVDAVGLSALLVSTARHMKTCVQSMHEAGLDYPVIIGGAPVNDRFAGDAAILKDRSEYKGGVFYARDAFTGLRIMQSLKDPEALRACKSGGKLENEITGERPKGQAGEIRSERKKVGRIRQAPFYGIRHLNNISADEVFSCLDQNAVFRLAWGGKIRGSKEMDRIIEDEYKPLLKELREEVIRKGWLDLKAVYGYFKCRVEGKEMRVLDAEGRVLENVRFNELKNGRCLTDYLAQEDMVAFQAATIGEKISGAIRETDESGEHVRAFYLHGLSVHLAEALTEYMYRKILFETASDKDNCRRFSPGYPLWADLADQNKLFKLLDINKRLGIRLTGDFQMIPEQSTTAIIIFDPEAEY